jgi:predicted nucleic acid-binding protein
MATAQQIRDLIEQTTSGTARLRVPREVRDEVCRYAVRRRREGAPWALIARETDLEVRKLQRWTARARRAASLPVLRPVEVVEKPEAEPEVSPNLALIAPSGLRIEGLQLEQAAQLFRLLA